ncbi:MAG: copper resistance protein NlpE N-terminal domain-containing protein [Weeksellaceae bacterium]
MKILVSFIVLISLIQCSQKKEPAMGGTLVNNIATAIDTSSWKGLYHGTVPYKHGVGMSMDLSLYPSNTYNLDITFLKKNPKDNQRVNYTGEIEWGKDSSTIILNELDTISNKFRVRKNVVEYLNPDATPNTGELAEFYILKRKSS